MRIVLTYGTFDLFHIGHVRLLQRARTFGDKLVVGVSSDEFNEEKGKKSIICYEHRAAIVAAMKDVDDVISEDSWNQKETDIKKLNADILVMGDDWEGKFDHFRDICEVKYVPRTHGISTSQLKEVLKPFSSKEISDLKDSFTTLENFIRQLNG
ncbi:adenylyltransferase/cytidyltransferase family protein [Epibacterium ulvae]|uniref:adenylyltransferase/cytidyltransferase family protein n=1 Tax=Epibacterium ulvae TaxID=1156985 RepID=UPI002490BD48|nr:adenylyltransferase/cytidyltransferase family protein [Epibacterium ulvae]